MVSVPILELLDSDAEEAGGRPAVGAALHQPSRRGVLEHVAHDVAAQAGTGEDPIPPAREHAAAPSYIGKH